MICASAFLRTILSGRSSTAATKKNGGFNPDTFLATIGDGRKILSFPKKQRYLRKGTTQMPSSTFKKAKCGSPLCPRSARKRRSRS